MKIAWFGHVPYPRGNGLVTYSRELPAGLRRRQHEVVFFYHDSRERGPGRDGHSIRLNAINVFDRMAISVMRARRTIEETLVREPFDAAHVSLSFSQLDYTLPEICRAANVPLIGTVHFPFGPRTTLWGQAARLFYRSYAPALREYDAVIVFSDSQAAIFREYGVPAEKLRVIPNGVDTATYEPSASDYKEHIGASLLVTYIGRVDPEKNVGDLAAAFDSLDLSPDYKLVVVGNGTELPRLRAKYKHHPRIHFTGYIGDVNERLSILRAADIFVLPSAIEGLSLALLEAMAVGKAIIATDVGADAEVLRGAGIVIDFNQRQAQLPAMLRTLIEYPDFRRDLATRARQRAVEQYSLETNIDRVVDLYRELNATMRARQTAK
ncbi:MAG: glycosyltransferase family 4 protein [Chloroflexi bacterium]|nr:glycosyltransferase family 4 protein [Chloroflexota bacterium]